MEESEMVDLIQRLEKESKLTDSVLNTTTSDDNEHSFTEKAYKNLDLPKISKEKKRQLMRKGTLVAQDDAKGQFSEMNYKINNKMSAYDLKVTEQDNFPLKVFASKFLLDALDSFELSSHVRRDFKKLFSY